MTKNNHEVIKRLIEVELTNGEVMNVKDIDADSLIALFSWLNDEILELKIGEAESTQFISQCVSDLEVLDEKLDRLMHILKKRTRCDCKDETEVN